MDISKYWETICHTLQDGVMVVDPRGRIMALNQAAERLTGYSSEELVGQSCRILDCTGCEIFDQGAGEKWCGLYAKGGVKAKRCTINSKSNHMVTVLKSAAVLKDDKGQLIGAVETLKDMSDFVRQQEEIITLRKSLHLEEGYHGILGHAPVMQRLYELIENVALSEAPVLIHGESGTGKELVARAIHEVGRRRESPFIKVNCAALNENLLESELFGHTKGAYTGADRARMGRFEAAHEGTIFLDEIGDIPLSTQVKLLRVLEEKEIERVGDHTPICVDVRVISATNRNLDQLTSTGDFREDLYFRINVFPLACPALREHQEDIPTIVQSFIQHNFTKTGKKILGLSPQAMEKLVQYLWPGNVRELRNAIEYAFVLCAGGEIDVQHLPLKIIGQQPECVPAAVQTEPVDGKRAELIRALQQAQGNQTEAARILGVSRITVWKRIKKFGIDLQRTIQ